MKMSIFAANISEDSRMQLHMYQTEIFLKIIFQKKRLALLESRRSTMVQRMQTEMRMTLSCAMKTILLYISDRSFLRKISKEILMEEKNLEITLRITEIQAILENNLYEDKKEEQELITELEQLEKEKLIAE